MSIIVFLNGCPSLGSNMTFTPDNNEEVIGKLSLIDLAGSERGADNAETDKTTRMEGRQVVDFVCGRQFL